MIFGKGHLKISDMTFSNFHFLHQESPLVHNCRWNAREYLNNFLYDSFLLHQFYFRGGVCVITQKDGSRICIVLVTT